MASPTVTLGAVPAPSTTLAPLPRRPLPWPTRNLFPPGAAWAPMPAIVLVGHDAATGPDFDVKDLPGTSGRLDVLARGLTTALLTSHGVRGDWDVDLVLLGPPDAPRRVVVHGAEVRHLNPDERSTALLFQKVLAEPAPGRTLFEVEAAPGFAVARQGLEDVLDERAGEGPVVVLDERGTDLAEADPELALPRDGTFVLSDHRDWTAEERALLDEVASATVSLGPVALHVHQALAVLQNAWDRRHGAGWGA